MRVVSSLQPAVAAGPEVTGGADRSTLRFDAPIPASIAAPTHAEGEPPRDLRVGLERELDRVQGALQAERTAYGLQLNWLMLSQGLFLNAYLMVLVLGFSTPLPAKRWLLAGLAIFATSVAGLIYLALRGSRDAAAALRQQRRGLEESLQREFARTPMFATRSVITRGLSTLASSLLPATFIAGWVALSLYTLAAPLNGQAVAAAGVVAPSTAASTSARTPPRAAPSVARPASAAPPAVTQAAEAVEPVAEDASPEPAPTSRRTTGGFKW